MIWKKIFYYILFNKKNNIIASVLYRIIAPKTLFRYRNGSERDIASLKNDEIWLSNMKNVNDIFEGFPYIKYKNLKLNFKYLEDMFKDEVINTINNMISQFYIACFCENLYDTHMWGYYSDNHKGFCIEYIIDDFKQPIYPIIYKKNRKINFDSLNEAEMFKTILTKDDNWKKEKEWRIVLPNDGVNVKGIKIKQPKIKAIYMGTNIEETLQNELEEYCRDSVIDLYKMRGDFVERQLVADRIL